MSWAGEAAKLDELAVIQRSGYESVRKTISSLYRRRRGAAADSKPENVDDGVGGGESVCADRESRTARYCIDGAVVFAHLYRMFTVLGVAGKAVNRCFRTTVAMVRFQRVMALCLLISAWVGVFA